MVLWQSAIGLDMYPPLTELYSCNYVNMRMMMMGKLHVHTPILATPLYWLHPYTGYIPILAQELRRALSTYALLTAYTPILATRSQGWVHM